MYKFIFTLLFLSSSIFSFAQNGPISDSHNNKGKIFAYWGWNSSSYTKSDIHFKGQQYNFTLKDVVAHDRQTGFSMRYFNPAKMTIPQYNFRIGYFFNPKYSISFGFDHMKYVMDQNQIVNISGSISGSGTDYDGLYNNEPIELKENFLKLEHTNGLNYLNLEVRRMDNLLDAAQLKIKNVDINFFEGVGAGILYPKTDITLINFERNDQWHLAGYGVSAVAGLNVTFFKHVFIQGEAKGGFINMPDVLTTNFPNDKAKQNFFFLQGNVNFGVVFKL